MKNLSKSLRCINMRNGVQIWLESDRCSKIQEVLLGLKQHMFVKLDDRTINTADVLGIFTPEDMEEFTRRKNGQWRCSEANQWHDKGKKCDCWDVFEECWSWKENEERYLKDCEKCNNSREIIIEDGEARRMEYCSCVRDAREKWGNDRIKELEKGLENFFKELEEL